MVVEKKDPAVLEVLLLIVVIAIMARLVVPYIIDFQKQAQMKQRIASLINLQKMLAQYKAKHNLQYPQDLSVFDITGDDFQYQSTEDRGEYVVSTGLDVDNDGQKDDYLYVTSAQFGVEKKLDAKEPPTLPLNK